MRISPRIAAVLVALYLPGPVWIDPAGAEEAGLPRVTVRERSIGTLHPNIDRASFLASPDAKRLCYRKWAGNKFCMVDDGVEPTEPRFDRIDNGAYLYSPDGAHLAYVGTHKTAGEFSYCLVLDGKPQTTYRQLNRLSFSPDSRWLAYVAGRDSLDYVLVLAGQNESPPFAQIYWYRFSPDGTWVVVSGRSKEDPASAAVVIGTLPGPDWKTLGHYRDLRENYPGRRLAWTADGRSYACLLEKERGTEALILDGQELAHCTDRPIGSLPVTPGWGSRPDSGAMSELVGIIDWDAAPRQERLMKSGVQSTWVHDLTYYAREVQSARSEPVEREHLLLSPNGKRAAAWVGAGSGKPKTVKKKRPTSDSPTTGDSQGIFLLDASVGRTREHGPFEEGGWVRFSPDSRELVFSAKQKNQWRVARVTDQGIRWSEGWSDAVHPAFSPDSKRFAYAARDGFVYRVVVDGKAGPEHRAVTRPSFSSKGDLVAYWVQDAQKTDLVIRRDEGEVSVFRLNLEIGLASVSSGLIAAFAGGNIVGTDGERHLVRHNGEKQVSREALTWPATIMSLAAIRAVDLGPRGDRFAFTATKAPTSSKQEYGVVVADGQLICEGWGLSRPLYSPDGKHVLYAGYGRDSRLHVGVDRWLSESYSSLPWQNCERFFDGPNRIHFPAIRDDTILLVELVIEP